MAPDTDIVAALAAAAERRRHSSEPLTRPHRARPAVPTARFTKAMWSAKVRTIKA
jgi:hypothetical protein